MVEDKKGILYLINEGKEINISYLNYIYYINDSEHSMSLNKAK